MSDIQRREPHYKYYFGVSDMEEAFRSAEKDFQDIDDIMYIRLEDIGQVVLAFPMASIETVAHEIPEAFDGRDIMIRKKQADGSVQWKTVKIITATESEISKLRERSE